jgi:hypothetical protein
VTNDTVLALGLVVVICYAMYQRRELKARLPLLGTIWFGRPPGPPRKPRRRKRKEK